MEEEVENQSMALNVYLVAHLPPTREQFILYRTTPEKVFRFLFKCSGVIYSSSTRIIFSQTALFGGLFSLGNVHLSVIGLEDAVLTFPKRSNLRNTLKFYRTEKQKKKLM
jgi:hypothetical protein